MNRINLTAKVKRIGLDARLYTSKFTGIGRYVWELIQQLAQIDQRTEFVCFLNEPEFQNFQKPGPNFRAVKVAAPYYSLAEQTVFLRALQRERLDLMHFPHFNRPLFYQGLTVVTIHDLILSLFTSQKMQRWYHKLAYNLVLRRATQQAQRVLTVSQHTKQDLQKILGLDPQKIQVVLNGLSPDFQPAPDLKRARFLVKQKFGLRDYLLTTGAARGHKNIPRLLRALAHLKQRKNFAGQLVLVGPRDEFYQAEIEGLIQEYELADLVVQLGFVAEEDLRLLLGAARVFVFPSLYEGFGFPPLEAMATGVPVVTSRASALQEVCGSAAEFFDPLDVAGMAEKIWRVWGAEDLRVRLIAAGLQQVKKFTWQKTARETYAVYQEVLGGLG